VKCNVKRVLASLLVFLLHLSFFMEKIRKWLTQNGFSLNLRFRGEDEVCFTTRSVTINSASRSWTKINSLLHECGHIAIWKCRRKNSRKKVSGSTLGSSDRIMTSSATKLNKTDRLALVTEEIEAWERGEKLAKRLKIRYSLARFRADRTRALMTYQRWSVS
jgi:hypothetical protein